MRIMPPPYLRRSLTLGVMATLVACAEQPGAEVPADLDAITSDARPTKRSEVLASADVASNSVVVFGGNDGPIVSQVPRGAFLDETWVFEPGVGWTDVSGEVRPKARGRYAVAHDEGGRRMLMFGGRFRKEGEDGDYKLFNDLWAFDYDTRTWREVHDGRGEAPEPRYYPAGAWDPTSETFYVWGGALNDNALVIEPDDALWAFKEGEGWREIETSGDAPSRRAFFGSTYDPQRNRLIVFAGQPGDFVSLAFQDLYALDLATGVWTELNDGRGRAPSTRMHPHIAYDAPRDRYLVFGGHTDIGDANDIWAFPGGGGGWEKIRQGDTFTGEGLGCAGNPSEVPAAYVDQDLASPERRHRGMYALMYDAIWVFGGIHAECSEQLDDTWRYDLLTDTWTELIPARTGESCLRRGDACTCLCL